MFALQYTETTHCNLQVLHTLTHRVHSDGGLAAFPQDIVCVQNLCNYLRPHAPHI